MKLRLFFQLTLAAGCCLVSDGAFAKDRLKQNDKVRQITYKIAVNGDCAEKSERIAYNQIAQSELIADGSKCQISVRAEVYEFDFSKPKVKRRRIGVVKNFPIALSEVRNASYDHVEIAEKSTDARGRAEFEIEWDSNVCVYLVMLPDEVDYETRLKKIFQKYKTQQESGSGVSTFRDINLNCR
jgi:hypothetical protein